MSERFYRQQMQYFNIKSVHELGQLHRGEITKTGKRSVVTLNGVKKQVLKADVIKLVNAYFDESVPDLTKLRMCDLNDLLSALAFFQPDSLEIEYHDQGRFKAAHIQEIEFILCLPKTYELDLTRLSVSGLKQLQKQLCRGINK